MQELAAFIYDFDIMFEKIFETFLSFSSTYLPFFVFVASICCHLPPTAPTAAIYNPDQAVFHVKTSFFFMNN